MAIARTYLSIDANRRQTILGRTGGDPSSMPDFIDLLGGRGSQADLNQLQPASKRPFQRQEA